MPPPDFLSSLPPAERPTNEVHAGGHAPTELDMALLEVVVDTRLSYEQDRRARLRRAVGAVAASGAVVVVLAVSGALGLVLP